MGNLYTNEEIIEQIRNNEQDEDTEELKQADVRDDTHKEPVRALVLKDYFKTKDLDMKDIEALTDQIFDSSTHIVSVQKKLTDYYL